MPKSYSPQERAYIQKRLKEEAAQCLGQYGIRRTTVDELVKRVHIPKGTFYLFYPSKEMLLFEVILEQHELMEQSMQQALHSIDPATCTQEQLTQLFLGFYQQAAQIPLLKMLHSAEIELLARKLPPEVLEAHLKHDNARVESLFAAFPHKPKADAAAFTAAFRALYFTTLHQEEIGAEQYASALRLLIAGLVAQLL